MVSFGSVVATFVGLTVAVILLSNVVIPTIYSSTNLSSMNNVTGSYSTLQSMMPLMLTLLPITVIAGLLLMVTRPFSDEGTEGEIKKKKGKYEPNIAGINQKRDEE